jgi:hypothetical protein
MPKVRLYGKKNVRTAAYNYKAAKFFLNLTEKQKDGQFFSSQASIVFSTFTYEAFLNTLGSKLFKKWDEYERDSVDDKLKTICEKIKYKPNKGKRPYQTMKKIYNFRNLIAHGKEEIINIEGKVVTKNNVSYMEAIESEWEKMCKPLNARKAYEDVKAVAIDLCEKSGIERFSGYPFGSIASGFFRVEKINA